MKLKDYKQMKKGFIYLVDNLSVVNPENNDENMVLSKYPQETVWYPFYDDEDWFKKFENVELVVTNKVLN